ncbi:hypothetical protein PILCRDRAFT_810049 [Piloderma croceum F 1598]|uniref:Uncharacterized protein n=1 Tax=Piloderma croceum (strain F 1598) TaxID=765440 RepID=A0A0C3CQW1_PILCF|nr:hypothetical protein PILCRDRAFT_810049 [Piloderma croceum F 1598]
MATTIGQVGQTRKDENTITRTDIYRCEVAQCTSVGLVLPAFLYCLTGVDSVI